MGGTAADIMILGGGDDRGPCNVVDRWPWAASICTFWNMGSSGDGHAIHDRGSLAKPSIHEGKVTSPDRSDARVSAGGGSRGILGTGPT